MNRGAVDQIRQLVDIVQIIGEVVPLKKSGSHYFGICPFHGEKTPSFSVSPTKQFFHCFGCKAGGDVFKFLQLYHRWDFPQVVEELAKKTGVKVEKYREDPTWDEGLQILQVVHATFEEVLDDPKSGRVFQDYLASRHLGPKIVKEFRLGAHAGGTHFVADLLKKKSLSCDIAVSLGLLSRTPRGDYIDRFQGRLMFPILDEKGQIRGFGGRTLGSEHPKYINSPKSNHFDKSRLFFGMNLACREVPRKGYAVLVEGYLDVMALHEFGVTNAIGSMGTALTQDQIRVLKRYSHRVISLYDADKAGLAATEKNLGNFLREGLESKVVILPGAKDPDAFLHDQSVSVDDRKKALRKAFEASISALDYLVTHTILNETEAMVRGQQLRKLVNLLDMVPDELERALMKKDLAKRFDLPESMLLNSAESALHSQTQGVDRPVAPTARVLWGGSERFEREIAKFLVKWGDRGEFPLGSLNPYLLTASKWASLLLRLGNLGLESKAIAELKWLDESDGEIENEIQSTLREWALEPRVDLNENELNALWGDLGTGLRRAYFQREGERLQTEIGAAEESRDIERVRQLLAEKNDLMKLFRSLNTRELSQL